MFNSFEYSLFPLCVESWWGFSATFCLEQLESMNLPRMFPLKCRVYNTVYTCDQCTYDYLCIMYRLYTSWSIQNISQKRAPLGVLAGVVGGLAICPWLDLTMSGPSYQRNASACFLHRQWLQAANPLVSFVTLQCRFSVIMNHFI